MLPEQRKRRTVELVREHGGHSVEELAAELDVSKATVRRDLGELEDEGLVERSHGGAVPATAIGHEQSYRQREVQNLDAKIAIGERAVGEIHEGDVVLFDSGTTTVQVAEHATGATSFVAVTNSPLLALELSAQSVEVDLTGGSLREPTRSLVGPAAEQFLEQRHFDLAFLGTNGVDGDGTLTTPDASEARMKSLLIERAERVVLVADATKYCERNFVEFGTCEAVDLLVSDAAPEGALADVLAEQSVTITVVDTQ